MGGRGAVSGIRAFVRQAIGKNTGAKSIPISIKSIKDKSLQGIEDRIRNLNHEEAFVFDLNDRLRAGVSGGTESVTIPAMWKTMNGATVTHGHPTGRYSYGGTLSMEDAKLMAETNWKEMRAVASGQGEFNYIMRRTPSSDNAGLINRINRDIGSIEKKIKSTYKNEFKAAFNRGATQQLAMKEAAQKTSGVMVRYWKKVLPQYGFEYVTRRSAYEYGR